MAYFDTVGEFNHITLGKVFDSCYNNRYTRNIITRLLNDGYHGDSLIVLNAIIDAEEKCLSSDVGDMYGDCSESVAVYGYDNYECITESAGYINIVDGQLQTRDGEELDLTEESLWCTEIPEEDKRQIFGNHLPNGDYSIHYTISISDLRSLVQEKERLSFISNVLLR